MLANQITSPVSVKITGRSFLAVWLYVVFPTSFILTDIVKGTTPAFIIAYVCPLVPLLAWGPKAQLFIKRFIKIFGIYLVLAIISQVILALSPSLPSPVNLNFISKDSGMLFRMSLFTQSLYVIPSFLFWIFVWTYYTPDLDKHIKRSLSIFVLYGLYSWAFFLLFGRHGDFISNRVFGDGELTPAQFQTATVMGISVGRFVSMTGEPSVYVFSVLPYSIYYAYKKSYLFTVLLFMSLILALSGTFIMGVGLWGFSHIFFSSHRLKALITLLGVIMTLVLLLPSEVLNYLINEAFLDKINQNNVSGLERASGFLNHFTYFWNLPFIVKLTGLGFGVVRSADLFSMLLVDVGIVGFLLFTGIFFYPVFKLPDEDMGLKVGLLVTYLIMMVSIAEYSYFSLWLFMGLAYSRLSVLKILTPQ